jgi:hypothetical protein
MPEKSKAAAPGLNKSGARYHTMLTWTRVALEEQKAEEMVVMCVYVVW